MNKFRILGIVFLAAGTLGLVYGGFSYTKATHEARLGPIHFAVQEQDRVELPVWAGVASIIVGGVLLLYAGSRR